MQPYIFCDVSCHYNSNLNNQRSYLQASKKFIIELNKIDFKICFRILYWVGPVSKENGLDNGDNVKFACTEPNKHHRGEHV
jgi:hypothetical protein